MNQITPLPLDSPISAPNIVLVASGKGGVGKTWFSISYSCELASKNKKVLLFDGDLGLANVDIQLGLVPEKDLSHYINNKGSLADSIINYGKGGFDIIAGHSGDGSLATLPLSRIETLQQDLVNLSANYCQIIIDLGAGLGGTVRQLSHAAGKCIVLVTDEPTSMTDAYAFIKLSRTYTPNLKLYIVINQAPSLRVGQKTFDAMSTVCKNFLNYTPQLAGIIPKDPQVSNAIRHQEPLIKRSPNSPAAEEVKKITQVIMKEL